MSDIKAKIRKLLALGNHDATNEHVASEALRKAREMMIEHGISEVPEDDMEHIHIVDSTTIKFTYNWEIAVGNAVAYLYTGRQMVQQHGKLMWFKGMQHQVDAITETYDSVCQQIDAMYKQALKAFDGRLSKSARMELRLSFKDAAAARVRNRIYQIVDESKPQGKGLVVVNAAEARLTDMLKDSKTKTLPARKVGFGSGAGYNAGALVRIQKEMK